ncbi:unnamed protein product [Boreogadus saida]
MQPHKHQWCRAPNQSSGHNMVSSSAGSIKSRWPQVLLPQPGIDWQQATRGVLHGIFHSVRGCLVAGEKAGCDMQQVNRPREDERNPVLMPLSPGRVREEVHD